MVHALITFIVCIPIALIIYFLKLPIALLYFLPAMFYLGREFTQAEYRYINQYCNKKRANMPWYAPFTKKAWNLKSMLDWVFPLVVSIIFFIITILFFS